MVTSLKSCKGKICMLLLSSGTMLKPADGVKVVCMGFLENEGAYTYACCQEHSHKYCYMSYNNYLLSLNLPSVFLTFWPHYMHFAVRAWLQYFELNTHRHTFTQILKRFIAVWWLLRACCQLKCDDRSVCWHKPKVQTEVLSRKPVGVILVVDIEMKMTWLFFFYIHKSAQTSSCSSAGRAGQLAVGRSLVQIPAPSWN